MVDLMVKLLSFTNLCQMYITHTQRVRPLIESDPTTAPLSVMAMATFDTFSEIPPLEHSVVPHEAIQTQAESQ